MAGKRHHIIPRFLQRGFASRIEGETVFTWLYTKKGGASKKEISTKDTIVSENFYGKKGSLNADDEITEIEKQFASIVNNLRNGKCDFINSKTEIAELIAHFSIRTKVIRQGFEDISVRMFDEMKDIFSDKSIIENLFNSEIIENEVMSLLPESEKKDVKVLLDQFAKPFYEDKAFKDEMNKTIENFFSTIFDSSNPLLSNSIKEGHIRSLSNHTIPENRVKSLEKLEWNVFTTNAPLILGDVACVFREIGEKQYKTNCDLDKIGQVFLPISTNQILIGIIEGETAETDVKVLNEAVAKCSYEQFICCEKADDKIDLIQFIGTNSYLAKNEEIESGLIEIREEIENFHNKDDK